MAASRRVRILWYTLLVSVFCFVAFVPSEFSRVVCDKDRHEIVGGERTVVVGGGAAAAVMTHNTSHVFAPRHVIILTYGRSGSTFLGEFFNQHRDALYWFEPLKLHEDTWYREQDNASPTRHAHFRASTLADVRDSGARILGEMLSCNFSFAKADTAASELILTPLLLKRSADGARITRLHGDEVISGWSRSRLASGLKRSCRSKDLVVAKTLRLAMNDAAAMMSRDPDLYVIYLTRDPRASARSRMKAWYRKYTNDQSVARMRSLCQTMAADYRLFQTLNVEHPDRTRHVVFERLATKPEAHASALYNMLGLGPVPGYMREWIVAHTQGSSPVRRTGNDVLTTYRNSSQVVDAWRTDTSPELARDLTAACRDVIELLGYDLNV